MGVAGVEAPATEEKVTEPAAVGAESDPAPESKPVKRAAAPKSKTTAAPAKVPKSRAPKTR